VTVDQQAVFESIREIWLAWLEAGGPYFRNAVVVEKQLDFEPGFSGSAVGLDVLDAYGRSLSFPPGLFGTRTVTGIESEFHKTTKKADRRTRDLLRGLRKTAPDPDRRPNHFRMRVVRDGASEMIFLHEPGLTERRRAQAAEARRAGQELIDADPGRYAYVPPTPEQAEIEKRYAEQLRLATNNFINLHRRPAEEHLKWIERFLWSHAGIGNDRVWEMIWFHLGTDERGTPLATQEVRWEGEGDFKPLPAAEPDLLMEVLRIHREDAGKGGSNPPAMSLLLRRDGLADPQFDE